MLLDKERLYRWRKYIVKKYINRFYYTKCRNSHLHNWNSDDHSNVNVLTTIYIKSNINYNEQRILDKAEEKEKSNPHIYRFYLL